MTVATCARDSLVRKTCAPLSISSCSSLRMAAMRSVPWDPRRNSSRSRMPRAGRVGAVNRDAGALACRVEAGHNLRVAAEYLSIDICGDAPHRIVCGGHDGYRFNDRINTEVGASKLGDIWEL